MTRQWLPVRGIASVCVLLFLAVCGTKYAEATVASVLPRKYASFPLVIGAAMVLTTAPRLADGDASFAGASAADEKLAEAIRVIEIGYEDVAAAGRVLVGRYACELIAGLAQRLRDSANELAGIVRSRGGEPPRATDAERRTCMVILQKLRARFGNGAVIGELEGHLRLLVEALDAAAASAGEADLRDKLIRHRNTICDAASMLGNFEPVRD